MQTQDEGYEYSIDENGEIIENNVMALAPLQTAEVKVNSIPQLIRPDEMPDLDDMQEGFTLAAKYIEFLNDGESQRGVFLGFTKMKNQKGEEVDLANFQNKDGVWVNAGANLVFQLRDRGVPSGTPLLVTYRGKTRTKSGNEVKTFDVRLLNQRGTTPAPNAPPPVHIPDMNLKAGGVEVPSKQTYTEKDFVELVRTSHITGSGEFVKKHITPAGVNWTAAYLEMKAILPETA